MISILTGIWNFITTVVGFIVSFIKNLIMAIGLLIQSVEYVATFMAWLPPAFVIFALVFIALMVLNFVLGFIKK